MQISILKGIFSNDLPDLRESYPMNLMPEYQPQPASSGYLRPAEGIEQFGDVGSGKDRGGILWNNILYRVLGPKLVAVTSGGAISTKGDVGAGVYVSMDYSFDQLAVASSGNLYYWDGSTFTHVTDPDVGTVLDVIWVDGYFMVTDGEFIAVSELGAPTSFSPIKYGSSEADPDPIKALLKVHNEPYVLNRNTIEIFENIGGTGFPFQRVEGAQIQHGVVGTHACCVFLDTIVFVGSGRNEEITVWQAQAGNAYRLATKEIDLLINAYPESVLSTIKVESRITPGHELVYIHLPDRTLVYDQLISKKLETPVWFQLNSGLSSTDEYRGRSFVRAYNQWWCGDTQSNYLGRMSYSKGSNWGVEVLWRFNIPLVYNEANGAIFHELALVSISNDDTDNLNSEVLTQYSQNGVNWSMAQAVSMMTPEGRNKNLTWLQQGSMRNWRIQRFYGTSDQKLSFIRLDARLEALTA